ELDLSNNGPEDDYYDDDYLSDVLGHIHVSQCHLQILRLAGCNLNYGSCKTLVSVLKSSKPLIELDLSNNAIGNSGVECLSKGLRSSKCKLQILRLAGVYVSSISCKSLASVLQSPNSLIELDLSINGLEDSGVLLLSRGLRSHNCKLQILRLSDCKISQKGCNSLASALRSNPSHLKELDLSKNPPGESGLKLLTARLEDLKL
ncbi:hypothetical protein AALO_G00093430, partial [Alosa alosa]